MLRKINKFAKIFVVIYSFVPSNSHFDSNLKSFELSMGRILIYKQNHLCCYNLHLVFRVSPNGNCLYNATSIYLVGHEKLHMVLRLLTSLELLLNKDYYKNMIETMSHDNFSKRASMIESLFSFDTTKDASDIDNLYHCLEKEAISNCKLGRSSPFICATALASVIETPIHMYYAPKKNQALFKQFNQVVQPRVKSSNSVMDLLWSTTESPETFSSPNHFVLLSLTTGITTVTERPEKHKISKKQSFISFEPVAKKKKQAVIEKVNSPIIPSSEIVQAANSMLSLKEKVIIKSETDAAVCSSSTSLSETKKVKETPQDPSPLITESKPTDCPLQTKNS